MTDNGPLHQDLFTLIAVVGIAVGGFLIGMSLFVSSITPTFTAPIITEIPPSSQPQENFLMGMEEDRVASNLYFDKEDYFMLSVDQHSDRSFRGVQFEFIEEIDEGRCNAWNVNVTFADGSREKIHHDYVCHFRGESFKDPVSLSKHNSPRAGIYTEEEGLYVYYIVSKTSPHLPNLVTKTPFDEFFKDDYFQMAIDNDTRWAEQTFDQSTYFDFIREGESENCRLWFIAIYWGGGSREYIKFEFDCENPQSPYDAVIICHERNQVGVLYDYREDQVYYLYHRSINPKLAC